MLTDCLLLVVGLIVIIKGGDLFVSAATRIAEFLRMPRVVIGSTLVSLATTTPELVVSIMAGAKGESGLAVGNAVGSCVCNVGLVLGVAATLKHVDIHLAQLRTPLLAMFGFGVLLFVMSFDLVLTRGRGLVLILGGVAYFVYDFLQHSRAAKTEVSEAASMQRTLTKRFAWLHTRSGSALQFLLAAGIVVVGSRLLVDSAVRLAGALGIPSIIIGLTVIAVGTSLPELITAVTSSRKAVTDLAIGNVLGANIANLTFIVGAAAVLSDVTLQRLTQRFTFPALLVVFSSLLWMLVTDRRVSRTEGVVLLVLYAFYLAILVLLTAALK